ncbi:hypothetical protein WJX79_000170 [Trebouxia sp. C0005]
MGANRKLQAEIDRTLKKVNEGIEVFDQIWEKVYDTENVNQKEKYESDLKKEIKKLQRYRDQIKTWIGSSDIKDKSQLMEARKSVERQMERFKVCEKEMKIKAFSKEGLQAPQKDNPQERAKTEIRDNINKQVEQLETQVEAFDSEIESLQSNVKRKQKPPPRLAHLEESVNRHKTHIGRLEQIIRLLDNDALQPDELARVVNDEIPEYIDNNQEDFDAYENPDDMYAELLEQLDAVEGQLPLAAVSHIKPKDRGLEGDKDKEKQQERERQKEREKAQAAKAQLAARGGLPIIDEELSPDKHLHKPEASASKAGASAGTTGKGSGPLTMPVPKTDLSAGPSGSMTPPALSMAAPSTPRSQTQPSTSAGLPAALKNQHPATTSQAMDGSTPTSTTATQASRLFPKTAAASAPQPAQRPAATEAQASGAQPGAQQRAPTTPSRPAQPDAQQAQQQTAPVSPFASPSSSQPQQPFPATASPAPPAMATPGSQGALGYMLGRSAEGPHAVPQGAQSPSALSPHQTAEMSQKASDAFDAAAAGGLNNMAELKAVTSDIMSSHSRQDGASRSPSPHIGSIEHLSPAANLAMLQACASRSVPQPIDSHWSNNPVRMRLPPAGVPASYPQMKLPVLDNPALFEKLDTEALFFAFYYMPGTHQQYLAARELKRQSWRYHKQHGAWFQRHEEPKFANEEYEQGTSTQLLTGSVH